jgi:hypothetical protein
MGAKFTELENMRSFMCLASSLRQAAAWILVISSLCTTLKSDRDFTVRLLSDDAGNGELFMRWWRGVS